MILKKISVMTPILLAVFLVGCQKQSDKWMGFFYPEGRIECVMQEFDTSEVCVQWAEGMMNNLPGSDYHCGYRCSYTSNCQFICDAEEGNFSEK